MPSLANAKMVFFCVSVGTTWPLSPWVWAASKSPRNCEVTFRSTTSCRGVSRVTRTTRFSALPYWLAVRMTSVIGTPFDLPDDFRRDCGPRSAAAVGGVGEGTQQQGNVIVLLRRVDGEQHGDPWVERPCAALGEVGAGSEGDRILAGFQSVRSELVHPPVGIGLGGGQHDSVARREGDPHPFGRHARCGVEDVGGQMAHGCTAPDSRSTAICSNWVLTS